MSPNELLGTYLNDHLAGSVAGRDLAEKIRAHNRGTPLGTFMDGLGREIEEDQETLTDLMRRLGVEESSLKQAAGSVLEKMTRVVFDSEVDGSPELNRLRELEILSIGIEGKLALWRTLQTISDGDSVPRLHLDLDLDRLADRAQRQLESLEEHRRDAAVEAFTARRS